MIKHLSALLFSALLAMGATSASHAACEAEGFVTDAGKAFMGAARSRSAAAFSGAASRYADLNAIALFALGANRSSLPKSRQAEYVALTRAFIGKVLAKNAGRFRASGISVVSCSGSAKALTVNTRLSGGQKLVFKLYKTRGGYRVRDVSVSSVWLAQQLRTTFASVLRKNGGDIDALFNYLRG
ncbi:MAG: ABC transporter substrate-binding protein [Rhizobiales bacterium]|nr:ABC transporter substrate-binding protein [Hyphomicrobiales bacterium]